MNPIFFCDTNPLTDEEIQKGERVISIFNSIMDTVPKPKIQHMVSTNNSGFIFVSDFYSTPAEICTGETVAYAYFLAGNARIVKTVPDLKAMLAEWYSDSWHYSKHDKYRPGEDYNGREDVINLLTDAEKEEVNANVKTILSVK